MVMEFAPDVPRALAAAHDDRAAADGDGSGEEMGCCRLV